MGVIVLLLLMISFNAWCWIMWLRYSIVWMFSAKSKLIERKKKFSFCCYLFCNYVIFVLIVYWKLDLECFRWTSSSGFGWRISKFFCTKLPLEIIKFGFNFFPLWGLRSDPMFAWLDLEVWKTLTLNRMTDFGSPWWCYCNIVHTLY